MAPPATDPFGNPITAPTAGGPTFGPGFQNVKPPSVHSVNKSSDNKTLIFVVGDPIGSVRRAAGAHYRVKFASIDLASPAAIADRFTAFRTYQQSSIVFEVPAGTNGGIVTKSDSTYAGLDGWFFFVAVNVFNIESDFVGPQRNPIIGINDKRVPPDVFNQTVELSDGGLDPAGRQLVKARCSCKVPSQDQGVLNVQIVNTAKGYGGTGYTHDFFIIFSGGGGTGAVAVAHVKDGSVHDVEVTAAGHGYTSPPTVIFDNGDGKGAAAFAFLTTSGSISGVQIYLGNYFGVGILVEAAEFAIDAPRPGDTIQGDMLLIADAPPPPHTVAFYFVALSQTGTRRDTPGGAPSVAFPGVYPGAVHL